MALVKPGPLVQAISGTIGGVSFASTRNGAIARKLARIPFRKSPEQLEAQLRMSVILKAWTAMSDAQRAQWNAIAQNVTRTDRLGRKHHMSGRTLWTSYQAVSTLNSPVPEYDPGLGYLPAGEISTSWSITSSTLESTWTLPSSITNATGYLWAQRHWSSLQRRRHSWTYLGFLFCIPPTMTRDWASRLTAALGFPESGELLSLRLITLCRVPRYIGLTIFEDTISY